MNKIKQLVEKYRQEKTICTLGQEFWDLKPSEFAYFVYYLNADEQSAFCRELELHNY